MRILAALIITAALTIPSGAGTREYTYTNYVLVQTRVFKKVTKRHGLEFSYADRAVKTAAAWVWVYTCADSKRAPRKQNLILAKLMGPHFLTDMGGNNLSRGRDWEDMLGATREMAFILMHKPFHTSKNDSNREEIEANRYACRFAKETALPYIDTP